MLKVFCGGSQFMLIVEAEKIYNKHHYYCHSPSFAIHSMLDLHCIYCNLLIIMIFVLKRLINLINFEILIGIDKCTTYGGVQTVTS